MLIIERNVSITDIFEHSPLLLVFCQSLTSKGHSTEAIFCSTHFLQLSSNRKFHVSQVVPSPPTRFDLVTINNHRAFVWELSFSLNFFNGLNDVDLSNLYIASVSKPVGNIQCSCISHLRHKNRICSSVISWVISTI